MSSSERATPAAARMTSERQRRNPAGSLAGLIDVLDRADGVGGGSRARTRRATTYGPAGFRSGAVRTVPLRSVQPAPMARPVPAALRPSAAAVPAAAPASSPVGAVHELLRRVALWGSGPQGEYLAWRPRPTRTAVRRPAIAVPRPAAAPVRSRRAPLLRGLVRRAALWGAGAHCEYLAWGPTAARPVPIPRPDAGGPVVLREMPSTPTIQPAATSPAAALVPRAPAVVRTRVVPPVPRTPREPEVVRSGSPRDGHARPPATGWPSSYRPSLMATGLVRARGDPLLFPARGSPPPARRTRSPGSAWSSFP